MAQCNRCGKKGFFLKVNFDGICESCELEIKKEKEDMELAARKNANEAVQSLYAKVSIMQEDVNVLVESHESGDYSAENISAALKMLQLSVAEVSKLLNSVKSDPINKLKDQIAESEKIILSYESKIIKIVMNKKDTGNINKSYRRHYKVVGTSFQNKDGTNRQGILRRIKFDVPEYVCPEVTVKSYEYEGEPAFAVYANDKQIGNISREDIPSLLENTDELIDANIVVFGGETPDKNCGAEIILTYKK